MTRTMVLLLLVESDEQSIDTDGEELEPDELSRIVPTVKHVLAKTMPQLEEKRAVRK